MATTYFDPAAGFNAFALQARTDNTGADVTDIDGEDARLLLTLFREGIVSPETGYKVSERSAGANMSVDVGSGDSHADVAIIEGNDPGQGSYLVRSGDAVVNLTVPAADLSNPRIDEVYLVVQDDAYDNSDRVLPRLAYRDGTPSSSPVAPGPDASWKAYMKLATIDVAAAATQITNADITDNRVLSRESFAFGGFVPTGTIVAYGGTSAPSGWLLCDGAAVSRNTYARLFSVLGTTYGAGDGSTTFNLPDLRQRFPLGKAASGTGSTLGATGGAIDHTHSGPSHTHGMNQHTHDMTHTHQVNPPATFTTFDGLHDHQLRHGGGSFSVDGIEWAVQTDSQGNHRHSVDIAAFTSGGSSRSSTGWPSPSTTESAGTGQTGSSNPPYFVLMPIIRAF